jgi:hypothetical protein
LAAILIVSVAAGSASWAAVRPLNREELTGEEKTAVVGAFAAAFPRKTVISLEAEQLDGPVPRVTVTFEDRERTLKSRLLQVADCEKAGESWDCTDSYSVVVLQDAPLAPRVRIGAGVPHQITECVTRKARLRYGRQFIFLTAIEQTDDGNYKVMFLTRRGVGETWFKPDDLQCDGP